YGQRIDLEQKYEGHAHRDEVPAPVFRAGGGGEDQANDQHIDLPIGHARERERKDEEEQQCGLRTRERSWQHGAREPAERAKEDTRNEQPPDNAAAPVRQESEGRHENGERRTVAIAALQLERSMRRVHGAAGPPLPR